MKVGSKFIGINYHRSIVSQSQSRSQSSSSRKYLTPSSAMSSTSTSSSENNKLLKHLFNQFFSSPSQRRRRQGQQQQINKRTMRRGINSITEASEDTNNDNYKVPPDDISIFCTRPDAPSISLSQYQSSLERS
jgi:hypothetical protein